MDFSEITDMIQIYFECRKNSYAAVRAYRERFPNREVPKPQKFGRLEANLRKYGAFKKPPKPERQFRNEEVELNVLLSVEETPNTSTREIAAQIETSAKNTHRILKKHRFKPYIPQKVQGLDENDPLRRLRFCNFFVNKLRENPNFYAEVIWSDECCFGKNGTFNRNVHRHWSREHPRPIVEINFQRRFSVNVWCGIFGNRLIGPVFIEGTLNRDRYHRLLTEVLQNFLDEMPLAEENRLYFQQDGAAPHNAHINTQFLDMQFPGRWIGTHGPIQWPARSPDLTPLDFFFWGYIRDKVYVTSPETVNILRQRIIDACRDVPPNIILNATAGVARRCHLCITQNGSHFEQYL